MTQDTARTVMLLNEIAELLDGYADADGIPSGGGYHPNRAMTLLLEVEAEIERLNHPACTATPNDGSLSDRSTDRGRP